MVTHVCPVAFVILPKFFATSTARISLKKRLTLEGRPLFMFWKMAEGIVVVDVLEDLTAARLEKIRRNTFAWGPRHRWIEVLRRNLMNERFVLM